MDRPERIDRLPPPAPRISPMISAGNAGPQSALGSEAERDLHERLIADALAERQRAIGWEMHDNVAQQLTGALLLAEVLRRQLTPHFPSAAATAVQLFECVQQAQERVWHLSRGLLPVQIDPHGLMAALDKLCMTVKEQSTIDAKFECPHDVLVNDIVVATHLFHIAQEAVQNAANYSQAPKIVVELVFDDRRLRLTVKDDGVGLPDNFETNDGLGIRIMRYRARLIGAQLLVCSEPHGGTILTCELNHE